MVVLKDFDLDTLRSCLQNVVDSVAWLTEDDNFTKGSDGCEIELIAGITSKLKCALRDVHDLHNRRALINRIPGELLGLIFLELRGPVDRVGTVFPFNDKWLKINRVCRHWRRTATFTPNLWTRLYVSTASIIGDEGYRFLSRSLLRSGVLPLTLYIRDCSSAIEPGFLASLLANMPRVQDLRLDRAEVHFLERFTQGAPELETLEIFGRRWFLDGEDTPSELTCSPFNGWQTPRLQMANMIHCEAWRSMTIRNLRYLIIAGTRFDPATATALFDVLALNASLEDLILNVLSAGSEDLAQLEMLGRSRPRVEMTKLKRVYIGSAYPTLIEMIAFPLVLNTTDGCAVCYDTQLEESPGEPALEPLLPCELFSPCRKLYVTEDGLVGVDNHSAFWSAGYVAGPLCVRIMRSPDFALQLEELWIFCYFELPAVPLQRMSHITKLVICEGHTGTVLPWLRRLLPINENLPELKELWVQMDIQSDDQAEAFDLVLQFLLRHNEAGRRVRTLRLFRMAFNSPGPVSHQWQQYSSLLFDVADEVKFEPLWKHPWIDLPSVCREAAPAHTSWVIWP